jgi:hypothetical protein
MSPQGLSIVRTRNKPNNASTMSRRFPMPRTGDVVASGRSARADVHAIRVVPAESHTIVVRFPEAIEKVRELARGLRVDAWYTSDHTHYALVATYRSQDETESSR